jgi:hypothetical protein
MPAKIHHFKKRLCDGHDMRRRSFSRCGILLRRTLILSFGIGAVLVGCAMPNNELPYYEPPSSSEAPVQLARIEGSFQEVIDLRIMFRRPQKAVCAYVFAVDGRIVGPRSACASAIPISPGKHTIVVAVEGVLGVRLRRAATILAFDAAEDHRYKVSVARASYTGNGVRADVWISDETTQTPVTEARLVISPDHTLSCCVEGL